MANRVLISSLGSSGDINPFVAIGRRLLERGHRVVMLVNPHFEARVRGLGLEFEPFGTVEQFEGVIKDPRLADANKSPWMVLDTLVNQTVMQGYTRTLQVARTFKPDLILHHHISFGTAWAAERLEVPTAVGVLTPPMWLNSRDAAVYRGDVPMAVQEWMTPFTMWVLRQAFRLTLDRWLNAKRRELKLPTGSLWFAALSRGGVVNLGLWSRHVRGAMEGDPSQGVICGYAMHDTAHAGQAVPGHVAEFLERCEQAGRPPVVCTLGSSLIHHAADFYEIAAEGARRAGVPVLLLTGDEQSAGTRGDVCRAGYVPHSMVLPRGCVTVHHAGAGTNAQALRSGKPAVIVPFVNDEFDIARRSERLGVAVVVKRTRFTAASLAGAMEKVRGEAGFAVKAAELGEAIRGEDGAGRAAEEIEGKMIK